MAGFALRNKGPGQRDAARADGREHEGLVEHVTLGVTAPEQVVVIADGQHEIDGPAMVTLMEGPEAFGDRDTGVDGA